jgi:peptidoglycan/LPS O-acetylase OafA/YrhL
VHQILRPSAELERAPTVAQALEASGGVGPGFNALRLGCAIAVVISHAFDYTGDTFEPFRWFSGTNRSLGGTAVYIFFLISGFLVATSFVRSRSISDYALRRATRILPAVVVLVLITAFVLGPAVTSSTLRGYVGDPQFRTYLWNLVLIGNDTLPGVFNGRGIIGTAWTLRYEVLCYAVLVAIGAAGLLVGRRGFVAFVLAAIVLGWLSVDRPIWLFAPLGIEISYVFRVFAYFAAGMAVYAFRDRIVLDGRVAIVALVLSVLALRFGAFHLFFPLLAAYLVPYVGLRCNLSRGPIRHNDYSYGIYLWGSVVQIALIATIPVYAIWWFNMLAAIPLTFALAILSWHFVEKPALAWGRGSRAAKSGPMNHEQ